MTVDELIDPTGPNEGVGPAGEARGVRRPIIDVRTPSEFAEDHLPGAVNHPVLDDAQRVLVGTLHRQAGAFEANVRGASLVSANIAAMLAGPFSDRPRDWDPIVYCWRGGSRSWSLATVLARIGWRVGLLDGGYRAWRQRMVADIDRLAAALQLKVIAGPTGAGKTRLLDRLAARGHQVLDLEALAAHRGSVLGALPDAGQPAQKAFDGRLWQALRAMDPARPVLVESESRKIGTLHLPATLIERMRAADCIAVELPTEARVALLRAEYPHLEQPDSPLPGQLERLAPLYPDRRVDRWRALAGVGDWSGLVRCLLLEHYDPAYLRSMQRNYRAIGAAPVVRIADAGAPAFDAAAQQIAALLAADRPSTTGTGDGAADDAVPAGLSSTTACVRSPSGP